MRILLPSLLLCSVAAMPLFAQDATFSNVTVSGTTTSSTVNVSGTTTTSQLTINSGQYTVPALTFNHPTEARFQFKVNGASVFFFNHDGTRGTLGTQSAGGTFDLQASGRILANFNGFNSTTGKVTIGPVLTPTPYKVDLEVNGNVNVNGNVTGTNIAAKYQDVAEWVTSRTDLAPGTVVILDPDNDNEVRASEQPYDTLVAGVVSKQPGLILGEGGSGREQVATTGRVKVRVDASRGPIRRGDLLVTSSRKGMAMKSEPIEVNGRKLHQPGTIVGKALEPLEQGEGEILVLLSLQ
jgi:hypothetical protein